MNRRDFLKGTALGGAGIVVAGSAAGGWRAYRAGLVLSDDAAFAPWSALVGRCRGDPRGLAAAAILASSPHNTQPWRISLTDGAFALEADTNRHLGALDPFRREMWIGLGAAIANAEVVAPGLGFRTGTPAITSQGGNGAGRIVLPFETMPPKKQALAAAIATRRTNRAPYDPAGDSQEALQRAVQSAGDVAGAKLAFLPRETERARGFAQGTEAATRAINADTEMSADGHEWFRPTARNVARHRDGVSLATAGLPPTTAALAQILPEVDAETAGEYWLDSTRDQLNTAAGFGLILVQDLDARSGQIAAGRLWQRLHLALTLEGLAAQPLNQMPEMVDRDRQLDRDGGWRKRLAEIAGDDGLPTFAFRYGHPSREVPHSARRPLHWLGMKAQGQVSRSA